MKFLPAGEKNDLSLKCAKDLRCVEHSESSKFKL
jgi:hypothetical protein